MAKKDYATPKQKVNPKKKKRSSYTRSRPHSSFRIFLSILILGSVVGLGLLITGMLIFNKWHLLTQPSSSSGTPPKKTAKKAHHSHPKKTTPQKTLPQYEFYNLLPQNTNEEEISTPPKSSLSKPSLSKPAPSPTSPPSNYFLQVASFNTEGEADGLRAQLILGGFNVNIEKASFKGKQWYRVVVGPYGSKKKAQNAQENLKKEHHFNSLLLEKKP